jgi:trk system potassium uptake protein TrkA
MVRRLLPSGAAPEYRDVSGALLLAEVYVHLGWVGRRMGELEEAAGVRVAYLTRLGEGLIPGRDTVYQEGDLVHVVLVEAEAPRVEKLFAAPPKVEG